MICAQHTENTSFSEKKFSNHRKYISARVVNQTNESVKLSEYFTNAKHLYIFYHDT